MEEKTRSLALIFISVCANVIGQILMKQGMTGDESISLVVYLERFFSIWVISGFFLYAFSAFVWLKVLTKVELSFAYPILSTSFVLIVFLSWLIFHEDIALLRAAGVGFICGGVVLVARS